MKFSNVTNLVFGINGELLNDNSIQVKKDDGIFLIEFGFDVCITDNTTYLSVSDGYTNWNGILICSKYDGLGCQNYAFGSVIVDGNFYSSIVYHNCFDTIGYHFFYDWLKFFIPEKPRCDCCKGLFKKQIVYVNQVKETMVKHFKLEDVYGNEMVNEDLRIVRKETP